MIREKYLEKYRGLSNACPALIDDLMAGDPATYKAGYTKDNAIIAAAEVFQITPEKAADLYEAYKNENN